MKRILLIFTIAALLVPAAGCAKNDGGSVSPSPSSSQVSSPTVNPKLTHTEGSSYTENDRLVAEGYCTALSDNEVAVRVANEIWSFKMSESATKELAIWNKDSENPRISVNTYIKVFYEEKDGEKFAQNFEIVQSN